MSRQPYRVSARTTPEPAGWPLVPPVRGRERTSTFAADTERLARELRQHRQAVSRTALAVVVTVALVLVIFAVAASVGGR